MNTKHIFQLLPLFVLINLNAYCRQSGKISESQPGWFSLGGRSTVSVFDKDGFGLGTGGQFRIQLSKTVNTDWFADYISINMEQGVRSIYYHIGWSVLFYFPDEKPHLKFFQPYIMAGHCFDYNQKTAIRNKNISRDRWGSAVQAGIGTQINLFQKFNVSITCQYMMHLTKNLITESLPDGTIQIIQQSGPALEGHLLTTISFNYKLFRLWAKK